MNEASHPTLPFPWRARWAFLGLVTCLLLSLAPAIAFASDAEERLEFILADAEDGYDMLEFEEATTLIEEGIDLADRQGIRNETVAQLYILLGLIRHADGDDSLAEDAFVQAIETDSDVEVHPFYRTPATDELMASAARRAQPSAQDDPSPDTTDPPPEDEVDPLTHSPIRRADAGEDLMFIADMPADLPVFRVHLHHRRFGESDFTEEEMAPTDATGFAYTLDGRQVRTSQLEYFITAVDRSGELVAESGRRTNPHRVSVLGDGERRDDSDDDDDRVDLDTPSQDRNTGFFAGLSFGTDIGFLPGGTPPTANVDRNVSPGVAPAFAHSLLDLGWRFTENNLAGIYFRWQFVPGQAFDALPEGRIDESAAFYRHEKECFGLGLPGDCLLGLKYQRIISSDVPQLYSSLGLGVGRIRNWLQLKQPTAPEGDSEPVDARCRLPDGSAREILFDDRIGYYCTLRDTVRTGWFHFGVGGGMLIPLFGPVELMTDAYLMVLVPDTSVNLDINVGMRFQF